MMGNFSAPRALQHLVTTEKTITPSPIGRDQKLWERKINPLVWDQGTPGQAHQPEPVIIFLRDTTQFPNWKQYPLRREAQEGLLLLLLLNHFSRVRLHVPHRRQATRLSCPWDSPGKNTGVGCHFLLQCMKVKSLSRVRLLATPWTAAYQAPPSVGFSRQEYWSGMPLPSLKNDYSL